MIKPFSQQLNLFLLALSFFSRLPVAKWTDYSEFNLNQANRYFALVGWLLGGLVALCYWLASLVLPVSISILLAMIFSLLLTGAFHEDGLADMADGFGGGFEQERKLAIMKDSRLGTYGSCALILALLGKYLLLSELSEVVTALLLAYPLSRLVAASFIFDLNYVSSADGSKSKPLATHQSVKELLVLCITGGAALLLVSGKVALIIVSLLLLFRLVFKRFLFKQIGGYTGDCLGGAQQISELLIYLILVAA